VILAFLFSISLAYSSTPKECVEKLLNVGQAHTDHTSYLAGMDKGMLGKVGWASLLMPNGKIADMGAGSGKGSSDLAVLFPDAEVVGVDLSPEFVRLAGEKYQQKNLSFTVGDISKRIFPENSLSGIFYSSVIHHVTSFNGFKLEGVHSTLDHAVTQLKNDGLMIIRDFVIPDGPEMVHLDLPIADGKTEGTVEEKYSTAELFERFAVDFKSSVHLEGGVPYKKMDSPRSGFVRYELLFRDATEFVLRKDYRKSYHAEILEEYTYMSQSDFENAFRARGLRIVSSAKIHNPWIVENRYEGKLFLSDLDGKSVPFPPTNYVIVGQKIASHEGAELTLRASSVIKEPKFLRFKTLENTQTGQVFDLVSRPYLTVSALPYQVMSDGRVMVLAKQGFPRPLTTIVTEDSPNLDGAHMGGYIVEPIAFIHKTSVPQMEAVEKELKRRADIDSGSIKAIHAAGRYQSSPGIIDEQIHMVSVEVTGMKTVQNPVENYSGFSSSGVLRLFQADQALRSSQVGGTLNPHFEAGIYHLLLDHHASCGPWIGDAVSFNEQTERFTVHTADDVLNAAPRRVFKTVPNSKGGHFLEVRNGIFDELSATGQVLASATREYVVPKHYSNNVAATIPVIKQNGRYYVGLEESDLPALQLHEGRSNFISGPAWRLPKSVKNLDEAKDFVSDHMQKHFKADVKKVWLLGGKFFSSAGAIPEVVYPMAVEVDAKSAGASKLKWVLLEELLQKRKEIRHGHLLVSVFRLSHALKILP